MLCIGSSLEVFPVAQLPELTLDSGGKLAISPRARRRLTRQAAVRMRGDVVEDLAAVVGARLDSGSSTEGGGGGAHW